MVEDMVISVVGRCLVLVMLLREATGCVDVKEAWYEFDELEEVKEDRMQEDWE